MSLSSRRAGGRLSAPRIAFTLVVTLALVGAGVAAGLAWQASPRPEDLAVPQSIGMLTLEAQEYADSRNVTLDVSKTTARGIASNTSGLVTAYACTPGEAWSSGTSPVSLNAVPLLALHTDVPLWRDLTWDDRGEDVAALQRALVQLGHDIPVDGWFGWVTWDAYRAELEKIGAKAAPRTFTRESVLWLPAVEVRITGCPLQVGDEVNAGDNVAERSGELSALSVKDQPANLLPGERTLTFGGITAPVTAEGVVTDPDALAQLAQTAAIRSYDPEGGQNLPATLQLAAPVTVYSLPVGSVADPAGEPYVTAEGLRYPVTIVASSLGRTLVTFPDGTAIPDAIDATAEESAE